MRKMYDVPYLYPYQNPYPYYDNEPMYSDNRESVYWTSPDEIMKTDIILFTPPMDTKEFIWIKEENHLL